MMHACAKKVLSSCAVSFRRCIIFFFFVRATVDGKSFFVLFFGAHKKNFSNALGLGYFDYGD